MKIYSFLLLISLTAISNSALSKIYKCKGEDGKTTYRGQPCAVNETGSEFKISGMSEPSGSRVANSDGLSGEYACIYKAMDFEFKLKLNSANKYVSDMDFVGFEKGNYTIQDKKITFTPTEYTINGKSKNVPTPYKRNIISNDGRSLVMTNEGDSDQFICKK